MIKSPRTTPHVRVFLAILFLLLAGCSSDSRQSEEDVLDPSCAGSGGIVRIAPILVTLDVDGTTERGLLINNGGSDPLCFDPATAFTVDPPLASLEIHGTVPEMLLPGESTDDVVVTLLPTARSDQSTTFTVTPLNGEAASVAVETIGHPLMPEDINSPIDLPLGYAFLHLVMPDGEDVYVITNDGGWTGSQNLIVRDGESLELDVWLGIGALTVGERRIESGRLQGDNEAQIYPFSLDDNLGMFEISEWSNQEVTGMLVGQDVPMEIVGTQDAIAIRELMVRSFGCEDCEICDNGVDDDDDFRIDCNDFDCYGVGDCPADKESNCWNEEDDDGDGLVDCDDDDCIFESAPGTTSNGDCGEQVCDDGLDGLDADGVIDCEDDDCTFAPNCVESDCDNGIDDNGDGLIDCLDVTCRELLTSRFNDSDEDRLRKAPCRDVCGGTEDVDFNGLVGCADIFTCNQDPACLPTPGCPTFELLSSWIALIGQYHMYEQPDLVNAGDDLTSSCGPANQPDVSFRWTAPFDGTFYFEVYNWDRPAVVYLLGGDCTGTELACEVLNGSNEALFYTATAGEELILAVEGFADKLTVNVALTCSVDTDCPGNSTCVRSDFDPAPWCRPKVCSINDQVCAFDQFCSGFYCLPLPTP